MWGLKTLSELHMHGMWACAGNFCEVLSPSRLPPPPLPLASSPLLVSMSPFLLLLFIACRAGAVGSREVGRVSRAHLGTCFFAPAAACAVIPQVNLKCDQSRTLRAIGNGDLILQSFACLSQSVRLRVALSGCLVVCTVVRLRDNANDQSISIIVCLSV